MTAETRGEEFAPAFRPRSERAPAAPDLRERFTAEASQARAQLAGLLELEPMGGRPGGIATWDDVVVYTAKALGTRTLQREAIERRTRLLADAVGNVDDPPSWPLALGRVLELTTERKNVLAIHRPRRMSTGVVRCTECGEWGGRELHRTPWPCPTARAMGVQQ